MASLRIVSLECVLGASEDSSLKIKNIFENSCSTIETYRCIKKFSKFKICIMII